MGRAAYSWRCEGLTSLLAQSQIDNPRFATTTLTKLLCWSLGTPTETAGQTDKSKAESSSTCGAACRAERYRPSPRLTVLRSHVTVQRTINGVGNR